MWAFKHHASVGLVALIIAGVAAESLVSVKAERDGYNQPDCPTNFKQAIDKVTTACAKMGTNQVCYGNSSVHADFQPGAGSPTFQSPGDIVDTAQVKQLTLGGMDTAAGTYGVAEIKVLATLTYPNQTQNPTPEVVTMLLFGNVQLTSATADASTAAAAQTVTEGATLTGFAATLQTLSPPEQTQLAHYQTLSAGNSIPATKTAAAQLTHAVPTQTKLAGLVDSATAKALTPTATGTVAPAKVTQAVATATKLAGIIDTATAAAPSLAPTFTPTATSSPLYTRLQGFYFQSSGTAPCDQAPYDGMLIQSSQGGQQVTLSINGAFVSLGSTLFVTAQPGKLMTIDTLEGAAIVRAGQAVWVANTSESVQVPLDANLRSAGVPGAGGPYSADAVRNAPTGPLPNPIPHPPVQPAPQAQGWQKWAITFGPWTPSPKNDPTRCPPFQPEPLGNNQTVGLLTDTSGIVWMSGEGNLWQGSSFPFPFPAVGPFEPSADGHYQSIVDTQDHYFDFNLTFTDSTHATGEITYETSVGDAKCVWTESVSLTKV